MSPTRPLQQKKIRLLEKLLLLTLALLLGATVAKGVAGYLSGATSFYADAGAGLLMVLTAVLALSRLHRTATPQLITSGRADRGYARIFSLMFTLVSFGLFLAIYRRGPADQAMAHPLPALGMAVLGLLFLLCAAVYLRRWATYYRLAVLGIGARYLWWAIATSVIVLALVALSFWTGWGWLDAVGGALQALMLLAVAYRLWTRGAAAPRVPLPEAEHRELKDLLHRFAEPRQISFSALNGVLIEGRRHITVIMGIPETWTVVKAQRSADELSREVQQLFEGAEVEIHIESAAEFEDLATHRQDLTREDFRG